MCSISCRVSIEIVAIASMHFDRSTLIMQDSYLALKLNERNRTKRMNKKKRREKNTE